MSNSFSITTPANSVPLGSNLQGNAVFTVTNISGRINRGRARVVAQNTAAAPWLTLEGEAERDFPIAATEQFSVKIAPDAKAPPGDYVFFVQMVGVENPDEDLTQGPSMTFQVPVQAAPKKFPWWILIAAGVVLVAIIGILIAVLSPKASALPDVSGITQPAAERQLVDAGFKVGGVTERTSGAVPKGIVLETDPIAGTKLDTGSFITLVLSSGPAPTATPTITASPVFTKTFTPTATRTVTPSITPSRTLTHTPTPIPASDLLAGYISAVSWGKNRIDLFVIGRDDALWHKAYDGNWSRWESLGGGLVGGPSAASWAAGRLDVFVRGGDNHLYHKSFEKAWSGWTDLGGILTSNPAAVSWASGRLDVFVRSSDLSLYHKWYEGKWSDWEGLGGSLTSGPSVASWNKLRLDVLVRGPNNAIYQKYYDKGWSDWVNLEGVLSSNPAAISWAPGRLDIFARGSDNALWHRWFDGGKWSGWESLGGFLTSAPTVSSWAAGRLDVFIRGSDNHLYQRTYDTRWFDWVDLGTLP